jgi:two-component system chemotaxis response regulator CheY
MRVLVADDETTSRLLIQAVVQRLGHECLVAPDGDRAWTLLQRAHVDVLITDWMMPGLDGPELCRRIRSAHTHNYTYIILATVLGERGDIVVGMEAGADDYLIKPLDPFDVQSRLIAAERVTALHRQLTEARAQLEHLNGELAEQARTDPLTQLGNRLRLREDLHMLHARAERHGRAYSIAMFDLDAFKLYNDTYGHPQGDTALRRIAALLATDLRAQDAAYRYGGEEFIVVLADESLSDAVKATDRLRIAVENLAIPHGRNNPPGILTISAGVAAFTPHSSVTADTVLEEADRALYVAKQQGRNRVAAPQPARVPSKIAEERGRH